MLQRLYRVVCIKFSNYRLLGNVSVNTAWKPEQQRTSRSPFARQRLAKTHSKVDKGSAKVSVDTRNLGISRRFRCNGYRRPITSIQFSRTYKRQFEYLHLGSPCGGGIEYLHRDHASRRRRRKGKSRIWDSKIWPRVLRDPDQKMTALTRTSSNCKRQTRPLVREGATTQQTRNCQTIIKIWS
jgi:hypothetical protein